VPSSLSELSEELEGQLPGLGSGPGIGGAEAHDPATYGRLTDREIEGQLFEKAGNGCPWRRHKNHRLHATHARTNRTGGSTTNRRIEAAHLGWSPKLGRCHPRNPQPAREAGHATFLRSARQNIQRLDWKVTT
jgi:hypothetical protein